MGRRSHYVIYLFLLALAGPASHVVSGQVHPAWLAGGALIVFAASFVVAVELTHRQISADPERTGAAGHGLLRGVLILLMGAIAVTTTVTFGAQWVVLFIFVATTGVMLAPLRRAPLVIAIAAVAAAAAEVAGSWNLVSATTAGSWALSIVMAGYITLLMRRRGALIAELRRTQSEVARLAAADAVADERLRFARDLHDLLGHSLSLIVLKAELARRLLERGDPDGQARTEVADLEEAARKALVEVREAVAGYRARSFAAELERSRAALTAAGVDLTVTGVPAAAGDAYPPAVDELLAWVAREATTNIVRHSSATRARIVVAAGETAVTLEVTDDGVEAGGAGASDWDWLAAERGGSGLLGLQERVAAAGGRFAAGPAAGGFRVSASVPLIGTSGETQASERAVAS